MLSVPMKMLMLAVAGCVCQELRPKNEILEEQVRVLLECNGTKRLRLNDDQRRLLGVKGKRLGRAVLRELATIVTPDTLLRWNRELVARKYDGSSKRRPGRPRIVDELRSLVVRMATGNEGWGYTRIVGELRKLRRSISRSSVRRILKENGIEPSPERLRLMPWSKFLKAHWAGMAATDFFTTEVWTKTGLVRYSVLFVIDLSTRRVKIARISATPNGTWVEQIARSLVDECDGFLRRKTQLIHDRDPMFTAKFRTVLRSGGINPVRLPARSPNLNALAEHYHLERPHQGIGNELIDGVPEGPVGKIERRERLGGLLGSYYREAA